MADHNVTATAGKGEGEGTLNRLPRYRITMTERQLELMHRSLSHHYAASLSDDEHEVGPILSAIELIAQNQLLDADISYAPDVLAPTVSVKGEEGK